jgi:ribosomal protein S1
MTQLTQNLDLLFQQASSKYNTTVVLTEEDKKNNVKILCREPYAQDLYDTMTKFEKGMGFTSLSKDLVEGTVYKVKATNISYKGSEIICEELNSGTNICIPFKEYSKDIGELAASKNREFFATIYKVTKNGEIFGSEKRALNVSYKEELFSYLKSDTWFEVKIIKLIKGGYLALYKNEIECFIPGSHAAANVVHNFNELLNKTLYVMVDNYDASNDLFILSYKKYVTASMPVMISELHFDKEYIGTLTTVPYDFGVFVEIEGYYTGLLHKSEFENYETIRKTLKSGDKVNVYVKDVTTKGAQHRIMFTLDQTKVSDEKVQWQVLRNRVENNSFPYTIDESRTSISIDIDNEIFKVSLRRKDLETNLTKFPFVKVFKVDPINKRLNFEFVETN